ncbi:MAG: aminotransferase class V-fold PLP-dependent enzyme, partial [Oscillospiraceae bacterium]|nr:aminotransferase class V-fold PLP-dependent enzyme [Oscillospiraceae bacterium]
MNTPVYDFVRAYAEQNGGRLHMPGHKGVGRLGCEMLDITEIAGADALYEANGIIAESEHNAAELFGSGHTYYSTEGSSHCIRAMLMLALQNSRSRTVVAARNVHKTFVYAAAALDIQPVWLYAEDGGLLSCRITPTQLQKTLAALLEPPAAVYVTSPDYLGTEQPIRELAEVCHQYGTYLLVDNAHGAYLHFLPEAAHPLDLGADLCCDSAHKTLPVLTGGAYLHLSKSLPACFAAGAKNALAFFGSTSPSYLTLCSLDLCNRYLADEAQEKLASFISKLGALKGRLTARGFTVLPSDPLRLTLCGNYEDVLRQHRFECEFASREHTVLMLTPDNTVEELARLDAALSAPGKSVHALQAVPTLERVC